MAYEENADGAGDSDAGLKGFHQDNTQVKVASPQANVQTKKSNIFKKMFSSKKQQQQQQQQQQQNATNTPSPRPRSKSEVGTAPSTARRLSFNFFGAGKNKNKADNGPDSILRSGRRRSSTHFGDPTHGEADEPRKSEDDDTFRRTLKRLLAHGGAPQDILNLLAEKDFDGAAFGNALLTCANQQERQAARAALERAVSTADAAATFAVLNVREGLAQAVVDAESAATSARSLVQILGAAQARAHAAVGEAELAMRAGESLSQKNNAVSSAATSGVELENVQRGVIDGTPQACMTRADARLRVGALEEAEEALVEAERLGAMAVEVDQRRCTLIERAAAAAADLSVPPHIAKQRRALLIRLVGRIAAARLLLDDRSNVLVSVRKEAAQNARSLKGARMLVLCGLAEVRDAVSCILDDEESVAPDEGVLATVLTWSLAEARLLWSAAASLLPSDNASADEVAKLRSTWNLDSARLETTLGGRSVASLRRLTQALVLEDGRATAEMESRLRAATATGRASAQTSKKVDANRRRKQAAAVTKSPPAAVAKRSVALADLASDDDLL
ncbi:hypothetical protein NFJ02_07g131210 [Pycnococcus provasolii]